MIKAIIVDDEMLARKRIISLLKRVNEIEIIKECSSGRSALTEINLLRPDLIFLDINMKDLNGFQVLQNIEVKPRPIVVFVTAHDKYALEAFDAEAIDFLVKPFKEERFYKTIIKVLDLSRRDIEALFLDRICELKRLENLLSKDPKYNSLPIKQGNKTILLTTNKIKYIIASGYYAEIYTKEKKLIIRESLSNLLKILDANNFYRVHRSAIVNLSCIREIVHSNYSEIDVRMKDNKLISVSKSHKKEFLKRLGFQG